MASLDQVPSGIKQILNRSMGSDNPPSLTHRFESPHPSLSHPGRLVALFGTVIGILVSGVDRLGDYLSVCNRIAAQLIRNDLPGLLAMRSQ